METQNIENLLGDADSESSKFDSRCAFYRLYRESRKLKRIVSIDSKHGQLKKIDELLSDFKNHKPSTIST